ncbi:MAG: MFS transporter, partial [Dehalococcoidia bacterium]|nr:MFS transporter [Dehalococcoidia bacterium]
MSPSSRFHYGWVILAMGIFVIFGSLGLGRLGYSMVLPAMQAGLGIDNTQAGLLATANLIGYLGLAVIGGVIAARYGPRMLIAAGLAVAGVGMVLTGLSDGIVTAAVWRTLTGIGSGASNVPMMALLAAWFASRRRGLATGVVVIGSSFALIFVGSLVPLILSVYGPSGWRVSWFVLGAVTLLLATAALILLRNWPTEKGLRPMGAQPGDSVPKLGGGGLEWGRVYRSPKVWHLGLVYTAYGFSYIIYMTFFTKHLIVQGGYTQEAAGRLLMTVGWVSLPCGLLWGTVSDTIGRKGALIIVYSIHAVAFTLFSVWPSTPGFTISAILFGLSAWAIPAIMAAACGDVLGPRLAPAALGFITLFFGLGQAIAPALAGALADASGSFFPAFIL